MQAQTTVQTLATEAGEWFESKTRDSGERYDTLKDGAPEWLKALVREAHGDMLPDDWRYQTVRSALEWISTADDPEDSGEFADDQVDVYTGDRLTWLASHLNRPSYCDQAIEDGLGDPSADLITRVGYGQYMEAGEVYGSIVASLQDREAELS